MERYFGRVGSIALNRARQRAIGRDVVKRLQRRLCALDACQCRLDVRTCGHALITFGTRKRPASRLASGALASASSVGNDGVGWSSRHASPVASGCEVATTPVVSIVLI